MSIFLFMKQMVDILYPYHWLDYMMVALALVALVYQVMLVRPNPKGKVTVADCCMVILLVLFSISFIRKGMEDYANFMKVLSAFLMYFVGRIYYERIQECEGALAVSSYIVVYVNLIYRVMHHGTALLQIDNVRGDLYYYDTDLGVAMLIALSFIAMYARNNMRKFFTMFIVIPYMICFSDAGVQKGLMVVMFGLLFLYVLEMAGVKKKVANFLLGASIVGLLVAVIILISPVFTGSENNMFVDFMQVYVENARNIYDRYESWSDVWNTISSSSLLSKLFGLGLESEIAVYSFYLKTLYVLGIVGLVLIFVFIGSVVYYVIQVEDRKTYYVTALLAIMLLGTGLLTNSIEATQMSWYPMMFAGMVVSSVQAERRKTSFDDYLWEGMAE